MYCRDTIYRAPTDIIENQNDPMHMVWPANEGINLRVREMSRNFVLSSGPLNTPSQSASMIVILSIGLLIGAF
jgi:hypothetical protein